MPAKTTTETVKCRRAVDQALQQLARHHGADAVRAAVNRWLVRVRAQRSAEAKLVEAEAQLAELKRVAGRR